jgi:hypothetical protein
MEFERSRTTEIRVITQLSLNHCVLFQNLPALWHDCKGIQTQLLYCPVEIIIQLEFLDVKRAGDDCMEKVHSTEDCGSPWQSSIMQDEINRKPK